MSSFNVKYFIRNWYVAKRIGFYLAPEVVQPKIGGQVYGHPIFADGKDIVTSTIARVNGREIVTNTGSIYVLDGEPCSDYLRWCNENGYKYDPVNPIRARNE